MLSNLWDMFRQWKFWKQKKRKHRRRSFTALSDPDDSGNSAVESPRLLNPASYLDLAVNHQAFYLVEEELRAMERTTARLLDKLSQQPDDPPSSTDEECLVCVGSRACLQTFPCGHRVLCRRCFLRTIQMAASNRQLPLRCVLCRTKIVRLKYQTGGRRVIICNKQRTPPFTNSLLPQCRYSPYPPSGILKPAHL